MSSTSSLRSSTLNDLSVPLRPFDSDIETYMVQQTGPPLKSGQMIYTLLCEAYAYWKLGDEIVTHNERQRYGSFANILRIVQPLPRSGDFMTPLHTGSANPQVVNKKFALEGWPSPFEVGATNCPPIIPPYTF